MTVADVEIKVREFADKARNGKIGIDDLNGGTFTISNGGVYGSLMSTPILNPPQSGILGMHKIQDRAMVIETEAGTICREGGQDGTRAKSACVRKAKARAAEPVP
jgi:pyruvate/2-oxoglutarate dehydrogenase complex dihydrolipoamide acyltransferase (E2) component